MLSIFKIFKYFFVPYFIIVLLALFCLATYSKEAIFLFINSRHTTFLDFLFSNTTYIGDGWCFGILLAVVFFVVKRNLFYLGVAIFACSSIISTVFKRLIFNNSPRPLMWFKNIKQVHFVDGVTAHSSNSFPSGHTITAFALAFYCTYLVKNKKLGVLFLAIAILVGYSRVYLGQHFFADITFGSILSIITSIVCVWIYEHFFNDNTSLRKNKQ